MEPVHTSPELQSFDPPRSAFGANEREFANDLTQVVHDWVASVSDRSNLGRGRHTSDPA